uniref:Uncharacterized protein, isoform C n=2 Tax=Drosophila melanogaster TaxID=7227 RepID=A0A0S0WGR0_DROME|nr:uncharacterized protein Dmel_CG7970, isoform C [Drosophila melanogaster]ALI30450.1 uncharacterized protein Dmel_CG7970, isoform C [Drosophila melanogaster]|eukprot:NP_001303378.1 uncharacterized protein Dmel_CG7970, isoform C [Drosophila melanogaster]
MTSTQSDQISQFLECHGTTPVPNSGTSEILKFVPSAKVVGSALSCESATKTFGVSQAHLCTTGNMVLSKPLYSLFGTYLEQLFNHPVRTKSITACVLATSANVTSQRLAGAKTLNQQSVFAYGLFGLIFGGSVPHYFYTTVERLFSQDVRFRRFFLFLSERLVYAPIYQALSLFFLALFEGKSPSTALKNVEKLYWPLLKANWQYLSVFVYLNFAYVPPMFRSISMAIISFIWVVYIAQKRRRFQDKLAAKEAAK